MAPIKADPSIFERLQVRIQSYPVPGDVIRYYPCHNNLTVCYTGVMSVNGHIYEVDNIYNTDNTDNTDEMRGMMYNSLNAWLHSLPNQPTVNDITVNYRLTPHPFYDQPPLSPRQNLQELQYVDMSRFMPGDIIQYYPLPDDDGTMYYEGILTKMMQVYEIVHPYRSLSRYTMYHSIYEYVDMINDDTVISIRDLCVNHLVHDD